MSKPTDHKSKLKAAAIGAFFAACVGALAAAVFALWRISSPTSAPAAQQHVTAFLDLLGPAFSALTPILIGIGAYVAWRRVKASDQQARAALEQVRIATDGQVTERFSRAVEQLGHDQIEVRLGGIYSLERIAKDSPSDHWTVMEVLCSYAREKHGHNQDMRKVQGSSWQLEEMKEKYRARTDLQAVLQVLGRRDAPKDPPTQRLDLSRTNLVRASLTGGNFEKAIFNASILTGADLSTARLSGAYLTKCILVDAYAAEADLSDASLLGADLRQANLTGANLQNALLANANLEDAELDSANLEGAQITTRKLEKAHGNKDTKLPPSVRRPPTW